MTIYNWKTADGQRGAEHLTAARTVRENPTATWDELTQAHAYLADWHRHFHPGVCACTVQIVLNDLACDIAIHQPKTPRLVGDARQVRRRQLAHHQQARVRPR